MWNFFEKSIRGGICNTIIRHVDMNSNLYQYDDNSPPCSLLYIDANNLYGFAMSMSVPYADFRWDPNVHLYTPSYIVNQYPPESDVGCFLEVDLEVPSELHDKFNALPLCPERCIPPSGKYEKLISTLEPKKNILFTCECCNFVYDTV